MLTTEGRDHDRDLDRHFLDPALRHLPRGEAEDRRTLDEVAAPEPSRLACQPVQPLEPGLAHPDRRPFQVAREEEERGADTEADAGGPPALLDDLRQQLLLRRAHGEQDEPGRLALDEVGGVQHRLAVADEAHGRVVVPDLAQAVAPAELLHHLLGAADDGQPLVRVGDVLEKHRRQVGARYYRQLRPA